MKLPNVTESLVPAGKITEYLLDLGHVDGGSKARFLFRFGFELADPKRLEDALLQHASAFDVVAIDENRLRRNHLIEGPLMSPDGRNPIVTTVWAITTDRVPRFVTLLPRASRGR